MKGRVLYFNMFNYFNMSRDFKKSEFKKVIGITLEDYDYIDKVRYKKSKAGMLKVIIDYYKKNVRNK